MSQFVCNRNSRIVRTTGGKIQGYFYNDVFNFKGVPYRVAERFHSPKPVPYTEGIFDATNYGAVCPVLSVPKPTTELKIPHRLWVENEDCLNLNIWTPALDDKKRPVLVWLHGGGLRDGSSIEQLAYEGYNAAKKGDIVVVSVNHRLNVLGYFDLSAFGREYENSGNNGTADTLAALKWVNENIENFGGDRGNITIMGQSGGGVKTTALLQCPEADGLYHKVINMSGVVEGLIPDAGESGRDFALRVMKYADVKDVKELEKVRLSVLQKAYLSAEKDFKNRGRYTGCCLFPNSHYVGAPAKNGFRKETANIPAIYGSVFGEFLGFADPKFDKEEMSFAQGENEVKKVYGQKADEIIRLFKAAYPERNPVDILNLDTTFRPGDIEYAKLRSKQNGNTYAYILNEDFDVKGKCVPWHCSDIPYFFANCELLPAYQRDVDKKIEDEIFRRFMAFMRTGNPNTKTYGGWLPCNGEEENTALFGGNTKFVKNHDHKLISKLIELQSKE